MRFARTRAALGAFFGTGLLAVAGAVVLPAGPAVARTGPAVAGVPQRGVPIPHGELFGVAATSGSGPATPPYASNAWAVGSDLGATIVQHWNGSTWK